MGLSPHSRLADELKETPRVCTAMPLPYNLLFYKVFKNAKLGTICACAFNAVLSFQITFSEPDVQHVTIGDFVLQQV